MIDIVNPASQSGIDGPMVLRMVLSIEFHRFLWKLMLVAPRNACIAPNLCPLLNTLGIESNQQSRHQSKCSTNTRAIKSVIISVDRWDPNRFTSNSFHFDGSFTGDPRNLFLRGTYRATNFFDKSELAQELPNRSTNAKNGFSIKFCIDLVVQKFF